MSNEKKSSDSSEPAVKGYFDTLIEDFNLDKAGDAENLPKSDDSERPKGMRDFSKFFNDAAAFGGGFESTIDKSPEEITDKDSKEETVVFSALTDIPGGAGKEIITTPVTDEDGMIVIFDEEAGIDATAAAVEAKQETESSDSAETAENEQTSDASKEQEAAVSEVNEETAGGNDFGTDENISDEDTDIEKAEAVETEPKRSFIQGIIPWKGDSAGEVIRKIVFMVSAGVFIGAGVMLVSTLLQSEEAVEQLESFKEEMTTTVATTINEVGEVITIPPTTEERIEHNESLMNSFVEVSGNVVGFVELPGCNIYYPVVQGTDNKYYLRHTYDDRQNKAGAIFMDYRCTVSEDYISPNIVLYGHNQEDGTMFGNLKLYKNNVDFYKYNPVVSFNTSFEIGDYVIFGYFIANIYEHQDSNGEVFHYHDYIETLGTESTFNWYMNEVNERNQIISPVDVAYGDRLLVLSTCSNEYSDSRFVVLARKLREGERVSDFDFSSARMNPYAKQIDWDAIMSVSSETESVTTEEITTTTTTVETTEETTTEATTTTEETTSEESSSEEVTEDTTPQSTTTLFLQLS